ncbi:MAG: DUF1538 domain-containing protein [Rhodospirillales bacterium]|nr:MAG: DUF1538 domain-containing protein [Rhodospirillales bacterium]
MGRQVHFLYRLAFGAARDLGPLLVVVIFFQVVVLRQPFPDLGGMLTGVGFVMVGLILFVRGLEMGLFPLGEAMAQAFARKGSLPALLAFAFALGFAASVAEPALLAVATEAAATVASAGVIADTDAARTAYALALRLTVAVAVGTALVFGVFRILKAWRTPYVLAAGYVATVFLAALAPADVVGIAFDCGGITTSTITVPLVAALGVGLATTIRGRNPVLDGFGLIAFACLAPILFVLVFGLAVHGI